MKIIHTADLHLREEGDERWEAMLVLLEEVKKRKADLLLIAGDLFDREADAERLRPKIRDLFTGKGFKTYILPGNHDQDSYVEGYYFGSDVDYFREDFRSAEIEGVVITGLIYQDKGREYILSRLNQLKTELSSDKYNILLYHGELLDAFFSRYDFGEEGDRRYMPVKLSDFQELPVNCILAGHFHSRYDVYRLNNGGYFVYPGSPVSVTRKEKGIRKANLLVPGNPPEEFSLQTFHYQEIKVTLDPFADKNPLARIKNSLSGIDSQAKAILIVDGYLDGERVGLTEKELSQAVEDLIQKQKIDAEDPQFEFRDIGSILGKDLFQEFEKKLALLQVSAEKKKLMRELTIKAMMGLD